MKIVCDACGAKYSIADEKVAGKVFKIRCKKCSNIIVVRGTSQEAAAPEESAEAPPNKETKVFDYQAPQDAMAAEGEWHLVIDQEQQGPMSAAQVRQHFAQGDIDAESYIWKEGFDNWERLVDVADFADLKDGGAGAGAAASGAAASGASASGASFGANAAADDGGLFGSAASSGGGDLFGGAASSGGGDDLFGGGAGDSTGEIPMSKEAEAQLKGQRSENSVLFSLGNLAALASDTPKPAASPHSASPAPGQPQITNTGGSEGSGLIDIRSMASVYLADKGGASGGGASASTPTGTADDLPVFSQSAFESASPVLLPAQSSGPDKKLLYTLVGAIGFLVVAATILVIVVLKGGDNGEPAVAANQVADTDESAAGDSEDTTATDTAPADGSGSAENTGGPDVAAEAAGADEAEEVEAEAAAEANEEKEEDDSKGSRRDRRKDRDRKKDDRKSSSKSKDPTPPKEEKSSRGGGGCDEVTCLVDPSKACCRKFQKKSGGGGGSSSSSNSNLPERPSRSDIQSGISKVRGRVNSCGDKHGGGATVKVKIKIGGDGKVKSANASGGGSALRSCVVSAVRGARFRKTQQGVSVTYPFPFR